MRRNLSRLPTEPGCILLKVRRFWSRLFISQVSALCFLSVLTSRTAHQLHCNTTCRGGQLCSGAEPDVISTAWPELSYWCVCTGFSPAPSFGDTVQLLGCWGQEPLLVLPYCFGPWPAAERMGFFLHPVLLGLLKPYRRTYSSGLPKHWQVD